MVTEGGEPINLQRNNIIDWGVEILAGIMDVLRLSISSSTLVLCRRPKPARSPPWSSLSSFPSSTFEPSSSMDSVFLSGPYPRRLRRIGTHYRFRYKCCGCRSRCSCCLRCRHCSCCSQCLLKPTKRLKSLKMILYDACQCDLVACLVD